MSKILVLFEYATLNGGERSFLAVLDGLRTTGFDVIAAAPVAGELSDELQRRGVEIEPLSIHRQGGHRASQAEQRWQLFEAIRRQLPDLVHANSLSMSRLAGPVVQQLGIPSVGHVRDIVRVSTRAIRDLNCHTRLLAVSQATRDWHIAAGLDPIKTFVLWNGVDLNLFQPRPAAGHLHRELGLPRRVSFVGTVGQIGLRKGQDRLLAAMSTVVEAMPEVHLLIVGRRNSQKQESRLYEQLLRHAVSAAPLAGRVHFLGWRDDLPRLLNELTLLVHAANQEPLGRVLLEAAAAGVPIVATCVGGTREIFPDDRSGARLVPPDDSVALQAAILEVLADRDTQQRMARAGRKRARRAFDARQSATGLAGHYADLLLNHGSKKTSVAAGIPGKISRESHTFRELS